MDIELLNELRPGSFEMICLAGPATEEEDLPPVSLGGSVMTHSCQPCNNTLGTRLERDLSHWFHGVLPHAQFTSPGGGGARNGGEVVLMSSPEGAPVLVPKGNHHQDVNDWIEAGREVALEWSQPDTNLVYLALLKQFYLAICLRFGSRRSFRRSGAS
jgi:hypothetical protein